MLGRCRSGYLAAPMQWYSVPPLLEAVDGQVLSHGWAYGHNGNCALRGRR